MQRQKLLSIVKAHQQQLQELGVRSLDLFGSVARNQAGPDSDADFLVEFSQPVGLFGLFEVQHYLESLLGCSVDIGTVKSLRKNLREPVLKDIVRVF
ncbi:hypothetical protein C1752_01051 [Acaryochloris thomasi RCC1774]|uniref:Polymerase nucleotidyl transferase domain-containing protein n=1 Tax=Acaryochloris thomasi RCC1774 TaxID=1764569 RepID=A0A2W1JXZ1_9CYAN|nr:nucleotidyltransferase family protein [Acaryochloris thomasi]PZD74912.1 hypothetical protein C1752_01051 [Acaryochloris thomasi RCC1774]